MYWIKCIQFVYISRLVYIGVLVLSAVVCPTLISNKLLPVLEALPSATVLCITHNSGN